MNRTRGFFLLTALFAILAISPLKGQVMFKAEIFAQDDRAGRPVFLYYNEILKEGEKTLLRHYYRQPEGTLFALEEVVLVQGELDTHRTLFPLLGDESLITREGDKLNMQFNREGKTRSRTINYESSLIFGPTQQDYIIKNLESLRTGGSFIFTLPAPEFLITPSFRLERIKGSPYEKPGTLVLEMKTRNIILSFLAKPNYFVVDNTTGAILEIHGPSVLKRKKGDKWEFFEADIYFTLLN